MERITGKIKAKQTLTAKIEAEKHIYGKLAFRNTSASEYSGSYEFTPTRKTQIVQTENKLLLRNIVIEPIPKNYGLITWNGSFLKVT